MSKALNVKIVTAITGLSLTAQPAHAMDWKKWIPGWGGNATTQTQSQHNTTPASNQRLIKVEKDSKVDPYFSNLTERAAKGELPQYVEGERVLRAMEESFDKATNKSVALVAPRGAGKTAAIEGYAQYLYNSGSDKVVMLLDAKTLISDSGSSSEGMTALSNILNYLRRNQNVILFIDEVHLLFPKDKPSDLANAMKDDLSRGRISIGTATTDIEWREYVEKDQAWLDRFNILRIPEMNFSRLMAILETYKSKFEKHHGVQIITTAIEEIARQIPRNYASDSYARKAIDIMDRVMLRDKLERERGNIDRLEAEGRLKTMEKSLNSLKGDLEIVPDDQTTKTRIKEVEVEINSLKEQISELKALEEIRRMVPQLPELKESLKAETDPKKQDVLKQVISQIEHASKMANLQDGTSGVVNRVNVIKYIATDIGTPADIVGENPLQRFVRLQQNLSSELIGQDEPIKRIIENSRRAEAGLEESRGPKHLFFVVGGSSLEQGLVVDILNEVNQGKENKPITVNFNEIDPQTAKHRLYGIETGYVGADRGGVLDEIRNRPTGTLHLNNVDQNSSLLGTLSAVIENGQTENSIGKKLDFRNATVILTATDLGREYSIDRLTMNKADLAKKYEINVASVEGMSQQAIDRMVIERLMLKAGIPSNIVNAVKSKIIVLNPVSFDAAKKITEKLLARKEAYIRAKFGVEVKVSPQVSEAIARMGYSPLSGAQGVQSSVSEVLIDTLSEIKVLDPDSFKEGTVLEVKFLKNSTNTGGDLQIVKDGKVLSSNSIELGEHPLKTAGRARAAEKSVPALKAAPQGKATNGRVGQPKNPTDPKAIAKDAVTKAKRTK